MGRPHFGVVPVPGRQLTRRVVGRHAPRPCRRAQRDMHGQLERQREAEQEPSRHDDHRVARNVDVGRSRRPVALGVPQASEVDRDHVRLAELVGALSLGIDLGFGQPMEHVLRQCLIAVRLAEHAGLGDEARAEVYYAASSEVALHLDDILTRRTHISIETWDRGEAAAAEVAELVAPVLGWNKEDIDRETQHYLARVAAERESQDQPDDHTADAARIGAPDVRMGATRHGVDASGSGGIDS